MNGHVVDVGVDGEKRLAEAAQNLLDMARALIPVECLPGEMSSEDKARNTLSSAVSLAVQALYAADHIGGSDRDRIKQKPREMTAMLHGLADGVGSCIGMCPDPIIWAHESVYFKKTMEEAMLRRGMDTMKRMPNG